MERMGRGGRDSKLIGMFYRHKAQVGWRGGGGGNRT